MPGVGSFQNPGERFAASVLGLTQLRRQMHIPTAEMGQHRFQPFANAGFARVDLLPSADQADDHEDERGARPDRPVLLIRAHAGDEHIVAAGRRQQGRRGPGGFSQPALGAVADHGVADLARGGEAQPHRVDAVPPVEPLNHHRAAGL